MKTTVAQTSIDHYHARIRGDYESSQNERVLSFIASRGGDWSIGEIADAIGWEKSTVSRVLRVLLDQKLVVEAEHRPDRISRVRVRPVKIPAAGQGELFQ